MTDIEGAKAEAKEGVAAAADELIDVSRRIHANPELAMQERQAASLLAERLEALGFQVESNAGCL